MDAHRQEIRELMIASNMLDGIYARMARKLGIKDNTLALLYALDDGAPHSQIEICRQWKIPKTTLNTIVQECIRKGYAELVSAAHTKEKHILLTPAGRQAAEEALRPLYAMEETAAFSKAMYAFARALKEEEEAVPLEQRARCSGCSASLQSESK